MKSYELRNHTFQIEDNDRLAFMADARKLYNQVAEDCYGPELDKYLEKEYAEAVKGDIARMKAWRMPKETLGASVITEVTRNPNVVTVEYKPKKAGKG